MKATPTSPLRRTRMALAALVLGTCSTVAVATSPGPLAGAATTDPTPPTTEVVYAKGAMDSSVVDLTGPASPSAGDPAAGTTGWATTLDLLPGTEMVALTWDAATSAPDGTVAIRSRGTEGWSPWTTISPEAGEVGDGADDRIGTDLVWLGSQGAAALEVRVESGPLTDLTVMRMRYHEGSATTVERAPESRTATRAAARPTIRPRSEWASGGWKSTTSGCGAGPSVANSLNHVVIHHTASGNGYTASQVPGILDGMYRYHTGSASSGGRGWCDLAYNFIVDKFGTIWQGRSGDVAKPVAGGHTGGFNTGSAGVSLLGNFETTQPTSAMLDATARLIAWKLSLHGLDPKGTKTVTAGTGSTRYPVGQSVTVPVVNYHQLVGQTACPGVNVISKIPSIRDAVQRYMGASSEPPPPTQPPPPSIDWRPFANAEDLVWRQFSDFRRNPGTYQDRMWWATELKAGRTNRNSLVAQLARSAYVQDVSADSVRLYLTYFGRIPDSAGIRYWWSEQDKGRNLRTVSARFSGSPEFKKTYGNLSDEQFVRLVYRNVLNREGTAADIQYWTGQITRGKDSRGGVMALFSKSQEYKARSQTVVEVILIHEVMLGRAISAQSHMQWVARVQSEGIGPLIGTLFGSSEYAQRV